MRAIPADISWRQAVDDLRKGISELCTYYPKQVKEISLAGVGVNMEDVESLIAYVEVLRVRSICPTCGMTVAECERTKTVCR